MTDRFYIKSSLLTVIAGLFLTIATVDASEAEGIEFFEKKIRPILVDSCYSCHAKDSEKGAKGGLFVDTRDGLLKGGDSGPSVVPGDPDKSLIIQAIRYTDENLQMPPKNKKLSAEQIADLEAWVKMGAPDPRTGASLAGMPPLSDPEKVKSHWAFQAVQSPTPPPVKNKRWVKSPIDNFILAELEKHRMTPSRQADKRTLIRRAYFDLTGMPPTPEAVDAFEADKSSDAFAKVIDQLLASPHYGERWGRYWLDIARYADTKGYVFEEERRYPYSYTYRDYVVRAFNEDLPYDRFLIEQIAADQLDLGEDKRALAGLGFLTLGRRFLNNQPDIIDDRIDVVTRGTMGLTVACARCHDHKYDPVPTKDYYSLYGVFASSSEPGEKPLLGKNSLPAAYPEYEIERKKREDELETFRTTKQREAVAEVRAKTAEYLLAAYDADNLEDKGKAEELARERKLDPTVLQKWRGKLGEWQKAHHPVFAPWYAFAALNKDEFTAKATELAQKTAANENTSSPINPRIAESFAGAPPASMKEVAERYGKVLTGIDQEWRDLLAAWEKETAPEGQTKPAAPTALVDSNHEALRQVLYGETSPINLNEGEIQRLFDVPTAQRTRALKRKLDELDATHEGAPPRAMALVDNETPHNPKVFVRGNSGNIGPEVPRQFLEVIEGQARKPFQKGSGRLEMAQAIASTSNPLTARVLVNRVWLQHFGAGLVRTPSDFGLRADPPTNPALLDHLASQFMANGWSVKKLHRSIMLSSTYQQSSDEETRYSELDPNNTLVWRMNRRRLDFEGMRDSLLAVSGRLDRTVGGHAKDIVESPKANRRTIYGFIDRQNLPGMFRTFDFASPDATSPQRFNTTVPQQALFLLNSPFVVTQTRSLLNRPEVENAKTTDDKIRALYELAYQRQPGRDELALGRKFLGFKTSADDQNELPLWQYGYGEIDTEKGALKSFTALPHFARNSWQGGDKLPDENLGWVTINSDGGHPGRKFATVRRWIAPRDTQVKIEGTLKHPAKAGDGVRGWVISSRDGKLGTWETHEGEVKTDVAEVTVKRGDTIDFVVDCRTDENSDSFNWAPVIRATTQVTGSAYEWNSQAQFSGPQEKREPLNNWEKYAQALLVSNELFFVD